MIGKVLVDRYRVENELGKGGFGEIYLVRDLQMPREPLCVVKHLKPVPKSAKQKPVGRLKHKYLPIKPQVDLDFVELI